MAAPSAAITPPPLPLKGSGKGVVDKAKLKDFFKQVVTRAESSTGQRAYLLISIQPVDGAGQLWDYWFDAKAIDAAISFIDSKAADHNIYFSPHLFDSKDAARPNILGSRTIAADIDEAKLDTLPLPPTVLVQTSETRAQAYWIIENNITPDLLETISRNMTYAIPESDRTGWPLGRRMRVPYTQNFKYTRPFTATVLKTLFSRYDVSATENLPLASPEELAHYDPEFVESPPTSGDKPQALLDALKKSGKLATTIATQYNTVARDRPTALWRLLTALFRAGLTRQEAYWLAKNTKNNVYGDLALGGDRELAKEVLRAEAFVKTRVVDPKSAILDARKMSGFHAERKQHVFNVVLGFMKQDGEFIRTSDTHAYYIRRDLGRPVLISRNSDYLNMVLYQHYGLNATENDHNYVTQHLEDYSRSLPITANETSLAWYDARTKALYLHTGKKEVIKVTPDDIERTVDGADNIVFPWPPTIESFTPTFDTLPDGMKWQDVMFADGLDNVSNLTKEEAVAVMTVWFMMLLFRNISISRPIMALLGSPGSGKSTMFRRVYTLLYGRSRSLASVTNKDDFDHQVAIDPLVVLDNVDTWERWLPDALALSAATSDRTKRAHYKDEDVVIIKRQAMVALTAHEPHFGRADVADRLLIINLERLKRFRAENPIIDKIGQWRNALWGGIISDVQRVLSTQLPSESEIPQFRIEDFSRFGCWIARALGIEQDFINAINRIKNSQRHFALEEENILIEAMQRLVDRKAGDTGFLLPGKLWQDLMTQARDQTALTRVYKNAGTLSKRLVAMQEPLQGVIKLEWRMDTNQGSRLWRLSKPITPTPTATPKEEAA